MTSNRIFSDVENALNLIGVCTVYVLKKFFKYKITKVTDIDVNHVSLNMMDGQCAIGGNVKGRTVEWIDKPWWKTVKGFSKWAIKKFIG